jgi:hypothetical protein
MKTLIIPTQFIDISNANMFRQINNVILQVNNYGSNMCFIGTLLSFHVYIIAFIYAHHYGLN